MQERTNKEVDRGGGHAGKKREQRMTKIPEGRPFTAHRNGLRGDAQHTGKDGRRSTKNTQDRRKGNIQHTGKDGRRSTKNTEAGGKETYSMHTGKDGRRSTKNTEAGGKETYSTQERIEGRTHETRERR